MTDTHLEKLDKMNREFNQLLIFISILYMIGVFIFMYNNWPLYQ